MKDYNIGKHADLLTNLIHDISSPNNSIMMNTGLLETIFKDAISLLKDDSGNLSESLAGIPVDRVEDAVNDLFIGIKEGAQKIQAVADNLKNI
jgi:signal transduction histidine kinase